MAYQDWLDTNPFISQLNVGGTTYDIKDTDARNKVDDLDTRITNLNSAVLHFKGTTTTAISDGSTTQTISIGGENYTAQNGDVVIYKPSGLSGDADKEREYVWVGGTSGKWQEFGSTGALKAMAFADTGTVAIPDAGDVTLSTPGTAGTGDISITPTITQKSGKDVQLTQAMAGANAVRGITDAGVAATLKDGSNNDTTAVVSTATVSNEVLTITTATFTPNTIPTMDTTNALATTTVAQQPEYESNTTNISASYTRSATTSNYTVNPTTV